MMNAERLIIDWGESTIRMRCSHSNFEDVRQLPADRQDITAIAALIHEATNKVRTQGIGIILRTREYFTRRLELHLNPSDNIRDVLQLQALAQFPDTHAELSFEAIRTDDSNTLLLFALPSKSLELYRRVAEAANVKLWFVAPAECATLQLIDQLGYRSKSCLVLTTDHEQRHLDLHTAGVITHVNSQPLDVSPSSIQRDCKRAILSSSTEPECLICCDDSIEEGSFQHLGVPIIRHRGNAVFAPRTNFLNSSLAEKSGSSHLWWLAASAMCAIALVLLVWDGAARLAHQQVQIAELRETKSQLTQKWNDASHVLDADQAIADWQSQRVDLLQKLSRVSSQVPAQEQVHLDAIAFFTGTDGAQPKLQLSGRARSVGQVLDVNEKIAALDGISLAPSGIREGQQNSDYPHVFDLEMQLQPKEATDVQE